MEKDFGYWSLVLIHLRSSFYIELSIQSEKRTAFAGGLFR